MQDGRWYGPCSHRAYNFSIWKIEEETKTKKQNHDKHLSFHQQHNMKQWLFFTLWVTVTVQVYNVSKTIIFEICSHSEGMVGNDQQMQSYGLIPHVSEVSGEIKGKPDGGKSF